MKTLTFFLALLMVAGCARSPEKSYYTLREPDQRAGSGRSVTPSYTIAIEALTVPESVDRNKMVTRDAQGTRMEISDTARWVEPLTAEIGLKLADDLQKLLPGVLVSTPGQATTPLKPEVSIAMDIRRFDGTLGQGVDVEAVWSCRKKGDATTVQSLSSVHENVEGIDHAALANAYSRALGRISAAIAKSLPSCR